MFHYRVFWVGWWGLAVTFGYYLLPASIWEAFSRLACYRQYTNGYFRYTNCFRACLQVSFPRPPL